MKDRDQFSRTPIYIALGLAIALTIGAIIGVKVVLDRVAGEPVQLSAVPAPQADTPECSALHDQLPDDAGDFSRVSLVEPAQPGAAAWTKSSQQQVTLRCGIDIPLQFTKYSVTETDSEGTTWLKITEDPGNLTTWFAVDRAVVVAVTGDDADGLDEALEDLQPAVGQLEHKDRDPAPGALADLPRKDSPKCQEILAGLPDEIDGLPRDTPQGAPNGTAVWRAEGSEPVVVACGIDGHTPDATDGDAEPVEVHDGIGWIGDPDTGAYFPTGVDKDEPVVAVVLPTVSGTEPLADIAAALARI